MDYLGFTTTPLARDVGLVLMDEPSWGARYYARETSEWCAIWARPDGTFAWFGGGDDGGLEDFDPTAPGARSVDESLTAPSVQELSDLVWGGNP